MNTRNFIIISWKYRYYLIWKKFNYETFIIMYKILFFNIGNKLDRNFVKFLWCKFCFQEGTILLRSCQWSVNLLCLCIFLVCFFQLTRLLYLSRCYIILSLCHLILSTLINWCRFNNVHIFSWSQFSTSPCPGIIDVYFQSQVFLRK